MINEKLSEIAQILCDLDSDRLVRNVDYKLNLQREIDLGELRLDQDNDGISDLIEEFKTMMGRPLFEFFDFEKIISRRTYKTFFRLFNNYNEEINKQEIETYRESREQDDFINACMETELMKEAHKFLVREEKAPEDEEEFKKMLDDIWFDFYGRSDKEFVEDSSAFEHVFIGERKRNYKVLGCHNWFNYYYLERRGEIKYFGYIPSKTVYEEDKETDEPGILAISFSMDGVFKPLGGFLIGFSPEFEIALYTIVFLCGEKKTRLNFANLDVIFECFKMERNDKEVLATIYPTV